MDGTLLDESSELPHETCPLIGALAKKGIRFAVATGRRLDTARAYFGRMARNIDIVASNGAQVVSDGRLIACETFSRSALKRLAALVDEFDCMHLALFDRTRTYLMDDPACYHEEFDKDLPAPVIKAWPDPETDIIKASVYCDEDVMDMGYVLGRELSDRFIFSPSGMRWIDVLQAGVSKASGMQEVLDLRGISFDEVMAFGDSMNDYELLRRVKVSCAMDNARPAIRQICSRLIGSNREHAVQQEMRRLLEEL